MAFYDSIHGLLTDKLRFLKNMVQTISDRPRRVIQQWEHSLFSQLNLVLYMLALVLNELQDLLDHPCRLSVKRYLERGVPLRVDVVELPILNGLLEAIG